VPSRGRIPGPRCRVSRRTALLAATALLVSILLLTLWPLPEQAYRASLSPISCLVCGDQGMQDVIQNVIMLLPLGLMLGLAGVRPGRAALAGFCLAFLIETLQYFVVPGRDASASDVLTNTAGTWLGALLAPRLPLLMRPGREAAARLAIAAVLAWAGAWVFGAWAIGGNVGSGNWRGRAPNDLPDAPAFSGEVAEVSMDGVPLRLAPADLPRRVEEAFARDSFVIEGVVRPQAPAAPRENLVTIIDVSRNGGTEFNNLVVVFNRATKRGVVGFRINAARLRLRTPQFNFGTMFDVPDGGSVRFRVLRAGGALRGTAEGDRKPLVTEFRLGPELLWSELLPRTPRPTMLWSVESFLWGAVLLGLAGYWGLRSARISVVLIALVISVAGQLAVPLYFPVARQSLLGWLMLIGGLVLGAVIGRRTKPPSPLHP